MNERIRILDENGQPIRRPAATRAPRVVQTPQADRQTPSRGTPPILTLSAFRELLEDRAQLAVAKARFKALLELRTELRDALEEAGLDFESRPAETWLGAVATGETYESLIVDALQIGNEYRDRRRRW